MRIAPRFVSAAIASGVALGLAVLLVHVPAAGGSATATSTLTVQLNGEGGRIVSSPGGIDCPDTCSHDFPAGTTVTLTATIASGHRLVGWFDGCDAGTGGTSTTCTLAVGDSGRFTGLLVLPAGTLQIAPRGQGGAVRVSPAGINASGGSPADPLCEENERDSSCERAYVPGTQVTLTAAPDSTTTLSGWSDPACAGTGPCTVTVGSEPATVVATFAELTLRVRLSSSDAGRVTSTPTGIDCPDVTCAAQFPAHSQVVLHVAPGPGHQLNRWAFGCAPNGADCTATMNDEPQWVGVVFDNDGDPGQPGTIDVAFEVRKAGDGSGRVSSDGLDCGSRCTRNFTFGTMVALQAQPDDGSTFAGWGGLCENDATTCSIPAGPVTAVVARFDKGGETVSTPLAVAVRGTGTRGTKTSRRVVAVLGVTRATTASLTLRRSGKSLASHRFVLHAGTNTLSLSVPRKVKPATYRLTITVRDPAGGSRVYTRSVRIGR